ncbi:MAG: hypothetical protein EOS81_01295 [Mesorhizobium sp.]|uniref:DUF5801 repeats-in-toxin domain-containing protein n=1 Tax=Mesorhizobium sp. TaxID=1871066 RepID=UPI000FD23A88|nr:DUF5801 repeats-in-toxin domain-containing protein [Mesorhizobium sp.]RVC68565.1 hypothetical protein EN759_11315 [Mesorhizobium sp. M00.F.Ca.ET.038.03.1.1]RWA90519.1 MAG: hypothetical protein EOQ31_13825 [Mesorhizobium sp.]RWB42309.1 MAG: hypothetical protein EOQ44_20915 [Mesorhizobium sp.]RWF06167.1 MAG: hypothetical protein EOS81_01295 [Mesorhizobium sp.]RWF35067.1 MAG: hypothetical protein EOS44_10200 [Mesorhizobium sp.]
MALTINVFGSTKIDETASPQDSDIALVDVPSNVSTAFSNAGANLANAIQVAGGGGDDLSVTPDSGFTVNGLGFVDPTNGALNGDASGLFTLEGREIFLYADPNNDNVVLGREGTVGGVADPSGAIVFAIYVEETTTNSLITGGKFWIALFEPLKHPDTTNDFDFTVNLDNKLKVAATQQTTFSFDNAPSGANEFMMFGNNPAGVSTSGIVVTGRAPDPNTEDNDHTGDTVSSSQAGPHATVGVNGQHLGPGNGLSFTFVDNPAEDFTVAPQQDPHPPQGLDSTEADHESNIQFSGYTSGVTAASFTVAQVNPTGNTVTVKITAFNDPNGAAGETGTGFVEGFADDVTVNITEVKINGAVVAANLSGDTAVISGVKNGDVVSYTTTSAHTRVLIENVQPTKGPGSNITLDIGGFTILSSTGASEFAGTQLQFDDDGPSITAVASTASVRHDETAGVQSDTDVDGTAFAFGSTTIASLFTNVPSPGDDPDVAGTGAIGFARSTASLLTVTGSAGADGPAAQELSYALSVNNGTDSGVETTAGTKIFLYNGTGSAAGLILGRVGTENTGGDTADPAGTVAFALATNATTGEVFLAQYLSLKHPTGGASYDETITLASGAVQMSVTRTDGDGDTATDSGNDIGLLVKFDDDGPTVTVNDIANGTYAAGGSSTWSDAPGADGFKSLNVTFNNYTIDSHSTVTVNSSLGTLTTTDVNGNYVFNGTITDDFTNDGIVNPQPVAFKLTFDAVDPGSGNYKIELTTPPGTITTVSSANGSLDAGGPDPVRTLTIGNRAIVFSAVNATTNPTSIKGFLDASESQIQTNATYLSPAQMNVSTSGIGLGNNNFDGNANAGVDGATTQGGAFDESFVIDPTAFLVSSMKIFIDNSVGGYDPSTEGIFYRTYTRNADNSITVGAITKVESADLHQEAGGQVSFVIPSIDQKNDLDAVQLFMGSGTVKVPVIEFNISNTFNPEALDMNFTATIADGDNDTKSDPFAIHVAIA